MIESSNTMTVTITRQEAVLIQMALQYSAEQITKWVRIKDRSQKETREMLRLCNKQIDVAKKLAKQIEEEREKAIIKRGAKPK